MSSSNAQKRSSGQSEVNHVLVKVPGNKTGAGFKKTNSFRKTTKTRWTAGLNQMYLGHSWRLPLIFGFSVIIFAITFIGLVFILASSQKSEAATDSQKKIVFVERQTPVESIAVLIPTRDIHKGEKLDRSLFKQVERPRVAVPVTVLTSFDQLKGGYARSNIIKDQAISQELVQGIQPLNPVIASIQPGYRAVTINVNATSSVEGWATAGAYVDVQWVSTVRNEKVATLITENAKILSAERQTDDRNQSAPVPTTITLLVSSKDAKKVSLASNDGQLILLLRGTEDINKGARSTTLTLKDLYNVKGDIPTYGSGLVKMRNADGSVKELSVVEGKIVAAQQQS